MTEPTEQPDQLLDVSGIAAWFRKRDWRMSERAVYRLPADGWPVVKIRGRLAARESALQRHLEVLEHKAENGL